MRTKWVIMQLKQPVHWLVVIGFVIANRFPVFDPVFGLSLLTWFYILIFSVTGIPKVLNIFAAAVIISLITIFFPPLGIILTIIFFIARISQIFSHWKPLIVGFIFYGFLIFVDFETIYVHIVHIYYFESLWLVPIGCGIILNSLLVWLYYSKYSVEDALGIMGATPVYVFMLILPFIADDIATIMDFSDYEQFEKVYEDKQTGYHTVNGHYRELPSGENTYVDAHLRSNPDGIKSNNLSYKK